MTTGSSSLATTTGNRKPETGNWKLETENVLLSPPSSPRAGQTQSSAEATSAKTP